MASLLIIDDDTNLCELLGEYLRAQGFQVDTAGDGQKGLRIFYEQRPALVILDVTMPKIDGWETLKRLREVSDVPVILLTARDEEPNILRGFSLGADDYVAKPFSFAQLAARIKAILARRGAGASAVERLEAGGLKVDLAARRVTRDGQPIALTPTEFKLLVALMREPGKVISTEDLVREVWGPQYANEIGFVRRYVWHLRQKVERDPENPQYIHNERGVGYRFEFME